MSSETPGDEAETNAEQCAQLKPMARWTPKSMQVFDLRSTCVSFGHPLALTLVELKFVRKSTQVFHRLATQRKSTQVDRKSNVYA